MYYINWNIYIILIACFSAAEDFPSLPDLHLTNFIIKSFHNIVRFFSRYAGRNSPHSQPWVGMVRPHQPDLRWGGPNPLPHLPHISCPENTYPPGPTPPPIDPWSGPWLRHPTVESFICTPCPGGTYAAILTQDAPFVGKVFFSRLLECMFIKF